MNRVAPGFEHRIKTLVDLAGGQRALARMIGVRDGTIIGWLGGSQPYEKNLQKIAETLRIDPDWLIHGRGDLDIDHLEPRVVGRDRLRQALERTNMSPAQLAKAIGYDAGVVNAVVNGRAGASEKMIEAIVGIPALGVTKEELMCGTESPLVLSDSGMEGTYGAKPNVVVPEGDSVRYVPEISWAQAGTMKDLSFLDEAYDFRGVAAINIRDRRAFAVAIEGDSMSPEIKPGDKAIVTPSSPPQVGDTVIVQTLDGRVMCKMYRTRLGGQFVVLESLNPSYNPIEIPREEVVWIYPVAQVTKNLRRS